MLITFVSRQSDISILISINVLKAAPAEDGIVARAGIWQEESMIGMVLSSEQVKSAPPVVRDWLEQQVAADFSPAVTPAARRPAEFDASGIASCSLDEVMRIFERVRHDGAACWVFLDFGREPVDTPHASSLYALDLSEIIGDTGVADRSRVAAALNLINAALQALRGDPEAKLFAIDAEGRCYVHELTHRALHLLRQDLLAYLPKAGPPVTIPVTCDPPYRCTEAEATAA
jgi:hypothetical protein